jgi:hypothetical protein
MIDRLPGTLARLALVALMTLLIAECALRATTLIAWDSRVFVGDADIGYRMRPGISYAGATMNAFGFNDVDHPDRKAGGVSRVAIIGDSFVFGVVPRAANVTAVLQRMADAANEKIEVLNMGIPGAGPKNYLRMIGKDAVDRHADIVGVVLFVGNDVVQAHPDFETRLWLGDAHDVLVRPYAFGWSAEYAVSYRVARAAARRLRERLAGSHAGTFSRQTFLEIERQRAEIFATEPSRLVRDSYAALVEIAARMSVTAQTHAMQLVVILAPDEIQVEEGLQAEVLHAFGLRAAAYDFNALPGRLERDLEAIGIPTLNLLPAFKHHHDRESLYAKQDTHWNEAGHALAGAAIREFIQARTARRGRQAGLVTACSDR